MREFRDLTKVLNVGDHVWSASYGALRVIKFVDGRYPICCDNGMSYMSNGRHYDDENLPTLFLKKPNIEYNYEPEREIDFSKLPRGVMCIVSDYEDFREERERYFSDYLPSADEKFYCYTDGLTNNKASKLIGWRYCEIHPSVKIQDEWLK